MARMSDLRVWLLQMGLLEGLSGALPPALGRLPGLTYVDLASNMLSGSLPAQLPASLQSIRLSGNMLTGTIPASYGAHTLERQRMSFVSLLRLQKLQHGSTRQACACMRHPETP